MKYLLAACSASLFLTTFMPTVSAVWEGTEDNPELRDAEGDISYATTDFARASYFLDISVSWLSYDVSSDAVAYQLRVADASALEDPPRDPYWRCETILDLVVGEDETGILSLQWYKSFDSVSVGSLVVYYREGSGSAGQGGLDVGHDFEFTPAQPGYFRWDVPRTFLQNHGEALSNLRIRCSELKYVDNLPTGERNFDDDAANARFDLASLGPSGAVGSDESQAAGPSGISDSATSPGESPAFGMAYAIAMLAIATVLLPSRKSR